MAARWQRRAVLARLVGLVVLAAPVIVAGGVCYVAGRLWVSGGWPGTVPVRVLVLAALGAAVGYGTAVAARRLLPLVMLLRLSLAFPDRAPSRAQVALRANRARRLQRQIERGEPLSAETPQQVATLLVSLIGWMTIHDRRTRGHAERVCAISALLADELGINGEERDQLAWAALLHDVGKIGVSAALLNKPAALDDRERLAVQRHTIIGHELTAKLADWLGPYRLVPLEHHEWFDGSGYPHAKAAEEISFGARVVAVADVLDVMTSARSYHRARSWDDARAELVRLESRQFDPVVVAAALRCGVARHRAGNLAGGALSGGLGALVRTAPSAVVSIPAGVAAVGVAGAVGAAVVSTVAPVPALPPPPAAAQFAPAAGAVGPPEPASVPSSTTAARPAAGVGPAPSGSATSAGPAATSVVRSGNGRGGGSGPPIPEPASLGSAGSPPPSSGTPTGSTAGTAAASSTTAPPIVTVTVPPLVSLPESLPIVGTLQTVIVTVTLPPALAPVTTAIALPTIPPALTTLPLPVSTVSSIVHTVTSVVPVRSAVSVVTDAVNTVSTLLPSLVPSTSPATTTTSSAASATSSTAPASTKRPAPPLRLPPLPLPGL
jgi:hypothetical protein